MPPPAASWYSASYWLVLLALSLLVGCGPRTTPVERAGQEKVLLIANGTDPEELDPHLVSGITEYRILIALFEGLVVLDPATLEPRPAAASHWSVDTTATVYRFHLNPAARWSNGDPVTADDFLFAYRRILTPALGSPYASMLYVLQGARDFHNGITDDFGSVGVRAVDPHLLELTLEHPIPYFLSLLAHFAWYPLHPDTILKHGTIEQRGTRWTRPQAMVSNGPFSLTRWNLAEVVEVEKNPQYWQRQRVHLNGIRFYAYENLNAEERAFRAGQVHLTQSLPLGRIDYFRQQQPSSLHIAPYFGTYYYALNVRSEPLSDKRVRQALSLALDRHSISNDLLQGVQNPAFHFTPPGILGYQSEHTLSEDQRRARELLAQAGYPDGAGFPRLQILYNTSENHRAIAELIQDRWNRVLNIQVGLYNQSWGAYLASRRSGEFDILRAGWIGDYPDPSTFLDLLTSDSTNNHTGWSDPTYDALIQQAKQTTDRDERNQLFSRAEAVLLDALPVIPIYFYNSAYLVHPSLHGWQGNLLDYHTYLDLKLSPSH